MRFENFIARRYLASKRKIQFITIISFISIIGITLGVAALLIVMSVFNGFTGIVTSILIGFDPHIRIEQRGGIDLQNYNRVSDVLKNENLVSGFSPFISGKAMIISKAFNKVVFIRGVDDEKIGSVSGVKDKIVLGDFNLRDTKEYSSIILGLTLSDKLGAVTGDYVDIVSPYAFSAALTPFSTPAVKKFIVTGIYESNNKEYDSQFAFISLESAQTLFEMSGRYSGVEARLNDLEKSESFKSNLLKKLPSDIEIFTWYDLHADLYSMMKIERYIAYILLSLIILVASFNLLGSLYMTVIEKRRDIGVLQSMGASQKSIIKIFMYEGILIGMIGNALGIILGLILIFLQQQYHLFPLDQTVYIIPAIPVEVHLIDFVTVTAACMILTLLASYFPARRASKIIPIESIRWE